MINSSLKANEYIRKIEDMGKGLALIKIMRNERNPGLKYHFFYENGYKPPFDLALDPQDNQIDYCSFFIQDEKVVQKKHAIDIEYRGAVEISDERLSFENSSISISKEFEISINEEDLFILEKDILSDRLIAYEIGDKTYILFSEEDCFEGIIIKKLSEFEHNQLVSANVI